jgi:hypothetical protein
MKNLIRKILKEEFKNKDTDSPETNICDVMSVNSLDEIDLLLRDMDYDSKTSRVIDNIKRECVKELETQSHDGDTLNTYFRYIQNMLCK